MEDPLYIYIGCATTQKYQKPQYLHYGRAPTDPRGVKRSVDIQLTSSWRFGALRLGLNWKTVIKQEFFSILKVFWSFFNLGWVLSQTAINFICRKYFWIFRQPRDPWESLHSDLKQIYATSSCLITWPQSHYT